ncbi:MAG TPA: DUF3341 domain-containing protein [Bryobacteraceae bacterium]|nr:DUF3341 domain-containing protein [Bryobacteraceae bacterium]
MIKPRPFGIAAEFEDPGRLVEAARAAREAGYRRVEAYSPYPIKELDEYIPSWNPVPLLALGAGIAGGVIGFYMQFFIAVDVYPTNIGGRPLNSWPMYAVITFELIVLFAICTVFAGTLFFEGLPALYHPLFRVPSFKKVTSDGFFFCIEARDGKFHPTHTAHFLQSLDPVEIWEVDRE